MGGKKELERPNEGRVWGGGRRGAMDMKDEKRTWYRMN